MKNVSYFHDIKILKANTQHTALNIFKRLIWMPYYFQVDEYMVFTVATNTFVEEVFYLVHISFFKN